MLINSGAELSKLRLKLSNGYIVNMCRKSTEWVIKLVNFFMFQLCISLLLLLPLCNKLLPTLELIKLMILARKVYSISHFRSTCSNDVKV
jgi:hypothetical protein